MKTNFSPITTKAGKNEVIEVRVKYCYSAYERNHIHILLCKEESIDIFDTRRLVLIDGRETQIVNGKFVYCRVVQPKRFSERHYRRLKKRAWIIKSDIIEPPEIRLELPNRKKQK